MKRDLLITEQEKRTILNMHSTYKNNKYVIEEADETFNTDMAAEVQNSAVTSEKAQQVLNNIGVDIQTSEVVDPNDCGCVPKTGDSGKDGIIARIWDWANNPENRGSLKSTLTSLRDAIKKVKDTPDTVTPQEGGETEPVNEQAGVALITIGGVALGPSVLIAIGAILLIIIVVALVSKGGKKRSSCKRRSKLFRKHGIDGMFM